MNKVVEFLKANPVQYLATVGRDGHAKCRPFMFADELDGKLWFCTNTQKEVYKDMQENPYVELSVSSPDYAWIRLHGKAVRRNRKFLHGAGVFRCVICRRFRSKRFVRTACDHTAGQDGSAGIRQQGGAHRHPLRLRAGQSVLRSRDADGNAGNGLRRLPCRCLCAAGLRCRQCFFFAGSAHEKDQHCQYERAESLHCSVLLRFTFVDLS